MTLDEIKRLIEFLQRTGRHRVRAGLRRREAAREERRHNGRSSPPGSCGACRAPPPAAASAAPPAYGGNNYAAPAAAENRSGRRGDRAGDRQIADRRHVLSGAEPEAKNFVDIGETVKKGQVLCIIEAMKLMNEIDSEYDGEVVNVYVENGQAVQYGERLFAIRLK
jgi:acetyl-CoA carboxylase biotin carboxyl carrier protein